VQPHRSPSPRLLLNTIACTRRPPRVSLHLSPSPSPSFFSPYPRCVIGAHDHYRVASSLERNKYARVAVFPDPLRGTPSIDRSLGYEVRDTEVIPRHLRWTAGSRAGSDRLDQRSIIAREEIQVISPRGGEGNPWGIPLRAELRRSGEPRLPARQRERDREREREEALAGEQKCQSENRASWERFN